MIKLNTLLTHARNRSKCLKKCLSIRRDWIVSHDVRQARSELCFCFCFDISFILFIFTQFFVKPLECCCCCVCVVCMWIYYILILLSGVFSYFRLLCRIFFGLRVVFLNVYSGHVILGYNEKRNYNRKNRRSNYSDKIDKKTKDNIDV